MEITKIADEIIKAAKKNTAKGFSTNIENDTIENENFRQVLYTGPNLQLVLMSLKPGEDIGKEVHGVDQFFRFESGIGEAIVNKKKYKLSDGISVVIPAGATHNIKNTGKEDLKMYTIYGPPHHAEGTLNKTKDNAMKEEEHFTGETTE